MQYTTKSLKSLERAKNKSNKLSYFHFMLIAYAKTTHVIIRVLIQTIYFLIHNLSGIQNDGDGREETDTQSNSPFFLNSSLINQIRLQNRGRRCFAYEKLPTSSILLWDKVHFFSYQFPDMTEIYLQ